MDKLFDRLTGNAFAMPENTPDNYYRWAMGVMRKVGKASVGAILSGAALTITDGAMYAATFISDADTILTHPSINIGLMAGGGIITAIARHGFDNLATQQRADPHRF